MTKRKRPPGRITAAEHEAWLKATGEYDEVARHRQQQEEERQKRAAEWRKAELPLVEELLAAGHHVKSAWDLVNTPTRYPNALPILLEHLQRPYPGVVREGIARALAVPEAKFAWNVLTRLYRDEKEERAKDGLAVAIAAIADDEVIGDVISLVRDTQHGPSRLLLLRALERSAGPRARVVLLELQDDPDLKKEIKVILRRFKQAKR